MKTFVCLALLSSPLLAQPATKEDRAIADRIVRGALRETAQAQRSRQLRLDRRQAERQRKLAKKQRMNNYLDAQAAAEHRAYQEWHQRYVADTPAREKYYGALQSAYQAEAARSIESAAYSLERAEVIHHRYDPWLDPAYQPVWIGPVPNLPVRW